MRPIHLVAIFILLALILPAAPAHAGGVVDLCTEARLTEVLAGGGTVTFACSGTITLTSTITIAANTTIDGSGKTVTLSGGGTVPLFEVNSGATLTLDRLTLTNGTNSAVYIGPGAAAVVRNSTFSANSAPSGGGAAIYVLGGSLTVATSTFLSNAARLGGAIYGESGTLSVTSSTFTANGNSSTDGAAIFSTDSTLSVSNSSFVSNAGSEGGAIGVMGGTATVSNSTFTDNSAGMGGAIDIFPGSVVVIDKCAIHENQASIAGGGIYNSNSSLTLVNSTVWDNLGTSRGGGIANSGGTVTAINSTISGNGGGNGGGIYHSTGTVTLKNTIVAHSSPGGNCAGGITNGGNNISYPDATCPGINADPRLGSPELNGGPTLTMWPSPGSPAIDAGDDAACAAAPVGNLDQRGSTRAGQGAHCDIGAYEVFHYRVTKTADESGACTSTDCALREAIMAGNAAPGHDAIVVAAGTYPLTLATPAAGQDAPGTGDLDITDELTIVGDAAGTIIHQALADRVFEIAPETLVAMRNLTIENGSVPAGSLNDAGGGIFNRGGLSLLSCKVQNNRTAGNGGGIANGQRSSSGYVEGSLTLSNSIVSGNSASVGDGGGIYSVGNLTVSGSTFAGNTAAQYGGGIENTGPADITNSTFYNNSGDKGGGISNKGIMSVINATLSGNSATSAGGAIYHPYSAFGLKVTNVLAANSPRGGNCSGDFTNGGGNLSYPDTSCGGINRSPLLGALQNNGGPTPTMALGAGSAAIDAGNTAGCQAVQINNRDQRGYARFVDGNDDKVAACDIGAYEYGSSVPPPAGTLDPDPPVVSIELVPAAPDGANGWYRSPVTVKPDVTDASPVIDLRCALDPASPPAAFDDLPEGNCPFLGGAEVSGDGEHTFYAAAMDIWGNKSEVVWSNFQIDATPPVLTCPEAGPFLLDSGEHAIGPAGVDASISGLDEAAGTLSGVVSTESVGPKTLTFTAFDLAGNSAGKECVYNVIYDFGGFYPPVEPAPALNDAKAGQAIPMKFSLAGDQGLDVIAEGYPASQPVDCETRQPAGPLVATQPPGSSSLRYAAGNGGYVYVWKTDKAWAAGCRLLVIRLVDGTAHGAFFSFQ